MTEAPEVNPPDGSLISDMAQKMGRDIDAAIARYVPVARAMGIEDPDLRDMLLSALAFNVARLEDTFGCVGAADFFLAGARKNIRKQFDEEGEPT